MIGGGLEKLGGYSHRFPSFACVYLRLVPFIYLRYLGFVKTCDDLTLFAVSERMRAFAGPQGGTWVQGFNGLLADLDALFDAEIARQEEEAADDLAISLKADRHLHEVLTDGAFQLVVDERTVPVQRVGRDFVQCREFLAPFERSHFIASTNERARVTDLSFVECLRPIARARGTVELRLGERTVRGVLSSVAPDHLIAETRIGSVLVPLGSISWVRFSPGDSAGAS